MAVLRYLAQMIDVSGQELPSEFPIFTPGENKSTKGSVWFDERSLATIMGAATAHGVDQMIDLEHYSIMPRMADRDSTDTDARGWYRPIPDGMGGLKATSVSWTDDGTSRLRGRRQRYTSPAFYTEFDQTLNDGVGGERVVQLINVALCSMPATFGIPPLVASGRPALDTHPHARYAVPKMATDREVMQAALASLQAGDNAAAQSALSTQLAVAPGDAPVEPEEDDAEEGDAPAQPEEYTALSAQLCSAAGVGTPAEAVVLLGSLIATQRAADTAARRSAITDLIGLGAETPATAWTDSAPCARLASEPLPALQARVAVLRTAAGPRFVAPPTALGGTEGLSDIAVLEAEAIKDPAHRSAFIASRQHRAARRNQK